ncbi:diguanylate cyclase [Pelomonas sp. CA6]|uniref:sensor domain-containing diguanylate cyclase n=1 Tax=Pelomonas sp. CA6 TaxID=2907999 RepID=UPI001F4BF977|nr:sensor domain-containing diguanylate cyclase [Pelomonas sp. CA6]MCH7344212.1 diguanylate cyclase [Pelomonas sp. CA6]
MRPRMVAALPPEQAPAQGVLGLLRKTQLRIALLAVASAGLVMTLGAALLLRVSAQRSLELQARSLAYSMEAAVVFQDAPATQQLLKDFLAQEPVAEASVSLLGSDASGATAMRPFARYSRDVSMSLLERRLTRWWPVSAAVPVVAQGRQLGELRLRADASEVLQLIGWSLAGVLTGMALTGLAVLQASRRLSRQLVAPLQALAAHTRRVRELRALGRRAPRAGLHELDQLSADFDALLDEVQAHQSELLQQHDELKTAHERLSTRIREDGLTGAATRAYFEDCLELAVQQAQHDGSRVALLFVDADRFKAINDQYGHEAGDQVLVALAQRLRAAVREQDLVARLGGDEFVVLMRSLRQTGDALRLAQQLRDAVAQPLQLRQGVTVTPGISVGVAVYPDQAASAEALLRSADQAMYRQKRAANAPSRSFL